MDTLNLNSPYTDHLVVFLGIFTISALGGVASLLRSTRPITPRNFISAFLNGGLVGIIIALLFWYKFQETVLFLIGLSALAGFGGSKTIEFLFTYIERKFLPTSIHDDNEPKN